MSEPREASVRGDSCPEKRGKSFFPTCLVPLCSVVYRQLGCEAENRGERSGLHIIGFHLFLSVSPAQNCPLSASCRNSQGNDLIHL